VIRSATPTDVPAIHALIRALAVYEKLEAMHVGTEEALAAHLFGARPYCEALVAVAGEQRVVGFALFFHNYSTFLARPGIYLEDLFVLPSERRQGHGRALLRALAQLALDRGCGRFEWTVLDWNEPAIRFYESLGAKRHDEWRLFRLTGPALVALANATPEG
jgi:GNAT superfamily N-acetyltransferase